MTFANSEKIIPHLLAFLTGSTGSLSADLRIGCCDISAVLLSLSYPSSLVHCAPFSRPIPRPSAYVDNMSSRAHQGHVLYSCRFEDEKLVTLLPHKQPPFLYTSEPSLVVWGHPECEARQEHLESLDKQASNFSRTWHQVVLFLCPIWEEGHQRERRGRPQPESYYFHQLHLQGMGHIYSCKKRTRETWLTARPMVSSGRTTRSRPCIESDSRLEKTLKAGTGQE